MTIRKKNIRSKIKKTKICAKHIEFTAATTTESQAQFDLEIRAINNNNNNKYLFISPIFKQLS